MTAHHQKHRPPSHPCESRRLVARAPRRPPCESPPPLPYLLRMWAANNADLIENVPVLEDEPLVAMPTSMRRRSSLKCPNNVDPQEFMSWVVPDEENDNEFSEFAISIREARDSGCMWEQICAVYAEKIGVLEALKAQIGGIVTKLGGAAGGCGDSTVFSRGPPMLMLPQRTQLAFIALLCHRSHCDSAPPRLVFPLATSVSPSWYSSRTTKLQMGACCMPICAGQVLQLLPNHCGGVLSADPKLSSLVMTSEEESSDFVFSVTIVVQTRHLQDGQITMQSHAFQHLKTNKTNVVQRNGVWCIHCATLLCAIQSQVSEPELVSPAAGLAMNTMGIHLHPDIHNVIFRAGLDNWFSARLSNTRTPTFGANKTLPIYGYRHLGQLSDISSSLELPARACSILRPLDMLAMDPDSGHQDTITFCRINAPFFDDPDFTHHFLLLVEQDDISHLLVPAARTGSHSTSPAMTDDGHLGETAAESSSSSMLSLSSEVGLQNATIGIQYIRQYINTAEFNGYALMKWSVEFPSLQPGFSLGVAQSSTSTHMPDTYTGSIFGSTSSSSDSFQMNDYDRNDFNNVDHSFDELFNNLATPSSDDVFHSSTSTSVYRPISHRDAAFISVEKSVLLVSTVSFDDIATAAGVTPAMASDARGHSTGHHRSLWDTVLQYYGLHRILDRIGISLPVGTQTIASHSLKSGVDVTSDIYECFQHICLWFKQNGYIDRHQRPNLKALDVYERGAAHLTMHKIGQNLTHIRTQQI
ncbi:hypothetical protein FISHEDRAFT_56305 [Fistulina hepatica ATCC 64428]|uniref:Uncharacterized protein n=1 Tax=Fistulina hepatica ATCC 64428 TaxID=1128425 RepID=A0A0D7AJP8_9AGAR|nr:hypothetical protein FISHEDRAFT_56305 [Fistulina hepatica ATCC 64428]